MTKIGLLSDTHAFFDEGLLDFFKDVDEIWHAGDIGSMEVAEKIRNFKPLRAVYGNIDDWDIRSEFKPIERFMIEQTDVLITHIGGYPGNYDKKIIEIFRLSTPDLFIAGHSHILKVMYDKQYDLLHINPGAAGISGFHKVRTAVRFMIEGKNIKDFEIVEWDRR